MDSRGNELFHSNRRNIIYLFSHPIPKGVTIFFRTTSSSHKHSVSSNKAYHHNAPKLPNQMKNGVWRYCQILVTGETASEKHEVILFFTKKVFANILLYKIIFNKDYYLFWKIRILGIALQYGFKEPTVSLKGRGLSSVCIGAFLLKERPDCFKGKNRHL